MELLMLSFINVDFLPKKPEFFSKKLLCFKKSAWKRAPRLYQSINEVMNKAWHAWWEPFVRIFQSLNQPWIVQILFSSPPSERTSPARRATLCPWLRCTEKGCFADRLFPFICCVDSLIYLTYIYHFSSQHKKFLNFCVFVFFYYFLEFFAEFYTTRKNGYEWNRFFSDSIIMVPGAFHAKRRRSDKVQKSLVESLTKYDELFKSETAT